MRRPGAFLAITVVASCTWFLSGAARAEQVVFARHLALSPDGGTLAFSWAGDIWTVPIDGGAATRLTVNPAVESNPVWSRDGRRMAFSSDRHGAANVFVMDRDGTNVRRLTFGDRSDTPSAWSADESSVLFHSRRDGGIYREPKVYSAPLDVGQLTPVMACHAADAQLSPDGRWIAFSRGGSRPWRRGYRGSANHDVWLHDTRDGSFRQFTRFDGMDRLPRWDADGEGLYFLSDRNGTKNVWYQPLEGDTARQVTTMSDEDVRDFAVARDGALLAFTHWDKLYVQAPPDGEAREIVVTAASDSAVDPYDLRTFSREADEAEVSPDGKEVALVVHGEIYVIQTEPERPTRRVTRSPFRDRQVTWSPDGKALYFVSDREGQDDIYRATSAEAPAEPLSDSLRFKVERVTDDPQREFAPAVSPNGKKLAFLRNRGDLIVRDLKSGTETRLLESWNAPTARWSPDGKWIAYEVEDAEFNPDVWIVAADGKSPAVNISRHPDSDGNPQWSADGQVLAFTSQRDGFDSDLYLVFLSPKLDEKSGVDLAEYFKQRGEKVKKRKARKSTVASGAIRLAGPPPASAPATSEPAEEDEDDERIAGMRKWLRGVVKAIVEEPDGDDKDEKPKKKDDEKLAYELETAWKRIRRVTSLPENQSSFALSPDGGLLAFASSHEGDGAVYQIKWNGEDVKQIIKGAAGALHWQLNGSRLFYLKGGVPGSCKAGGSDGKTHGFRAKMQIDRAAEARQKFDDAARTLGLGFYHPTLKDLDWDALTAKYRALALATRTWSEFNQVFNMLQGELNGSHLGIGGPGGGGGERVGYLGCDFDATFAGPGLRVSAITRRTPADRDESRLYVGDVLLAVNGEPVGPNAPIERAMVDTVNDPVILEIVPSPQRVAASQPATDEATTGEADEPERGSNGDDDDRANTEVVIRPTSFGDFANKCYDAWVEENRKYVEERSDGRVGYCHIRAMGESSFYVFERDLYAAAHGKDGLIIDVRNNGGGWTADWVMAVLSVRRHAYTIPRGGERGYPQGRLIFYAWTKPATMMCNQYSYSNAEIVSHAFKNLKRGPLVGMTTFGAVISTGSYGLIDGSRIRMPFRGWYTLPDGADMEDKGAVPDVIVPVTPEDEVHGRYPQLDAAIQATLEQIAQDQ